MTEDQKPPRPGVRPTYRFVDPEPPEVMHIANFHRLGTDVLMTVGRFDVQQVVNATDELKAAGKDPSEHLTLEVEVFDRFAMSPDGFARLFLNAQKIFDAMVESGHIKVEEIQESEHAIAEGKK